MAHLRARDDFLSRPDLPTKGAVWFKEPLCTWPWSRHGGPRPVRRRRRHWRRKLRSELQKHMRTCWYKGPPWSQTSSCAEPLGCIARICTCGRLFSFSLSSFCLCSTCLAFSSASRLVKGALTDEAVWAAGAPVAGKIWRAAAAAAATASAASGRAKPESPDAPSTGRT